MRGHGATGGHLVEAEPTQEHEAAGLLHSPHLFFFLHSQEVLGILHELQTGEPSKPSLFLNPVRVKAKLATPTPPRTRATIPTSNICFQVKFITPSIRRI